MSEIEWYLINGYAIGTEEGHAKLIVSLRAAESALIEKDKTITSLLQSLDHKDRALDRAHELACQLQGQLQSIVYEGHQ